MSPFLGRNFAAMDPLEWLFYGEYSNRVRGTREPVAAEVETGEEEEPRKRCLPSWARPIAKV